MEDFAAKLVVSVSQIAVSIRCCRLAIHHPKSLFLVDQHPHLHSQPPPSMSMPTGMGGSLRQQDALYPTGIGGGVDLTLDRSLGRIGARLANVDASREKRMASSGGDLTYGHMKDRSDKRVG